MTSFEILDFRARPATHEFMGIYERPGSRDPWAKFRSERPATTDVEGYFAQLRAHGIGHGVFTGRQGVLAGEDPIPNDFVLSTARASDGRVTAFAGIDPRDTAAALSEMDRCIDQGAKGFAFDPPSAVGFGAGETWDGAMMRPLLEHAQELAVPVVLTMGPIVGKHGDPEPVDRVAADLPELTIVCSHGVWPRTADMLALAFRRPNVVLELSIYLSYPGTRQLVQDAARSFLVDQLVYASAYPFMPLDSSRHVLALDADDEAKQKILAGNGRRLLGLAG